MQSYFSGLGKRLEEWQKPLAPMFPLPVELRVAALAVLASLAVQGVLTANAVLCSF